jgi:hypothetical protein
MPLDTQRWEKLFFHSCYIFPPSSAFSSVFESIRYFFRSFEVRRRISIGYVANLPAGKSRGGATNLEPPDSCVVQKFLATLWSHKDKGTTFRYPGSTDWEISPSQVANRSILGIGHSSHESTYFKKNKVTDEFCRCVIVFETIKSGMNRDFVALQIDLTYRQIPSRRISITNTALFHAIKIYKIKCRFP